jgi:uncharacterized phage infection (PIP) family protein YhgE
MEIKVIDKRLEEHFHAFDEIFNEAEIEKNNLKKAQDAYAEITKNLKELENGFTIKVAELENSTKGFNEVIENGLKLIDSKLGKINSNIDDLSARLDMLNKSNVELKSELSGHIAYFNKSPLKRWISKIKK